MNKVTYEEVVKKLIEIEPQLHQDDYDLIKDFIIQNHKPPTLYEVQTIWEELGYTVESNYDSIWVFKGKKVISIDSQSMYSRRKTDDERISIPTVLESTELNAINLTIRYLEAQHKEKQ